MNLKKKYEIVKAKIKKEPESFLIVVAAAVSCYSIVSAYRGYRKVNLDLAHHKYCCEVTKWLHHITEEGKVTSIAVKDNTFKFIGKTDLINE